MKRSLSFLLAMIVVFCTLSSVTATVYADYDANLIAHQITDNILQKYVEPSCHLDVDNVCYGMSEEQKNELKTIAEEVVIDCTTEYEKISAIAKFIGENIYYDDLRSGPGSSSPYEVWTNKISVCAGYANLTKALLNLINIPSMHLFGEAHAYNAAYDSENDRWIYLDTTWGSGNHYKNGEYFTFPYSESAFDMSLEKLSNLTYHEVYGLEGIIIENIEYYLVTPNDGSEWANVDWTNLDEWCISISDVADKDNVTAIDNLVESIENIPLKSIGDKAFDGCTNLVSVTIPDSVTSIGRRAFYGCTNLPSVELPDGVTSIGIGAFSDCINLTKVTMPNNVISIGDNAFTNCASLTSIIIPDSVTSIGWSAFYGCTNLQSVNIMDLEAWCNINFSNNTANPLFYAEKLYINNELVSKVVIPDDVTKIPVYGFSCTNLTSITIPDSVTSIGVDVFYGCTNLQSVYITDLEAWCDMNFESLYSNPLCYADNLYINDELVDDIVIPNGVTQIPKYGFSCTNLTSIEIPNSVTSISKYAFSGCANLTSITVPESVKNIDDWAFSNCENLVSIEIPDSIISIGDYAFKGCTNLQSVYITDITAWCNIRFEDNTSNPLYYAENLYINKELVTEIVIPFGVTKILGYSFNCRSFTSITIPDSVTSIDDFAFYNCESLVSIEIPDSVTSIGIHAFSNCNSLTSIKIPSSVSKIDDYAFYNCASLTSITIPDSVTSIGKKAITSLAKIFCYENSVAHDYAISNTLDYILVKLHSVNNQVNIDYDNKLIFSSVNICTNFTELISTSKNSVLDVSESSSANNTKLYGTGSNVKVTSDGLVIDEYIIIAVGDLNGDSVCDVLDAAVAQLYSSGLQEPTQNEIYAANGCISDVIDVNSYQNVVNTLLAG